MKKKKLLLGLGLCSTMLFGTGCSKDEKAVANEEAPIVCTQEDLDELTANLVAKQKEYEAVSARLTEVESLLATETADKEALESANESLLTEKETLINQKTDLESEVSRLRDELTSLQGEYVWINANSSSRYYMDEADSWWSNVTLNGTTNYTKLGGNTYEDGIMMALIPNNLYGVENVNSYIVYYEAVFPYIFNYNQTITRDNAIVNVADYQCLYIGNSTGFDEYTLEPRYWFNFTITNLDTNESVHTQITFYDSPQVDFSSIFTLIDELGTDNYSIYAVTPGSWSYNHNGSTSGGGGDIEARFTFDFSN